MSLDISRSIYLELPKPGTDIEYKNTLIKKLDDFGLKKTNIEVVDLLHIAKQKVGDYYARVEHWRKNCVILVALITEIQYDLEGELQRKAHAVLEIPL